MDDNDNDDDDHRIIEAEQFLLCRLVAIGIFVARWVPVLAFGEQSTTTTTTTATTAVVSAHVLVAVEVVCALECWICWRERRVAAGFFG